MPDIPQVSATLLNYLNYPEVDYRGVLEQDHLSREKLAHQIHTYAPITNTPI